MEKEKRDAATARVRDFYDGPADTIYRTTWGENLHLGLPRDKGGSLQDAMVYATERMASVITLDKFGANSASGPQRRRKVSITTTLVSAATHRK